VAPLINVSSAVDNTGEETCTGQALQDTVRVTKAEEVPPSCTSGDSDKALHTESVVTSWEEQVDSQGRKVNEICPWEDE
jgi:hypothetical protein